MNGISAGMHSENGEKILGSCETHRVFWVRQIHVPILPPCP
jgi:hypothetical protein